MSKNSDSNTKIKQSIKEVLSNNIFFLRLVFFATPVYLILFALDAIRGELSIFFEHTVGIGYVIEAAEFGYSFRTVATFILILAGAITLGMIFTVFVGAYVGERSRPIIREKIKMRLYSKAKDLDLACYDNPEFYNEQVLALSEVDKQIDRTLQFIQKLFSGVTILITSSAYILSKDKYAILFVLASFVASFCLTQVYNKLNFRVRMESLEPSRKRDYIKRLYYLSDYAKELRLNPKLSDLLLKQFDEANDEVYRAEKKYSKKKIIIGFLNEYVAENFVSDVLFISYLVYKASVTHTLSFSAVAILFASFGRLRWGLRIFADAYPLASENSLYIGKIRKFLAYEPKIVSTENLEPSTLPRKIELNDVSFSYSLNDGDEGAGRIINDVSLSIAPGEKIALVGYNGAGKTTLVKLLMRLYDVDSGVIKADDIDIKRYDVKKYRETIGTVFQDFQIFAGSIRENVLLDSVDESSRTGIGKYSSGDDNTTFASMSVDDETKASEVECDNCTLSDSTHDDAIIASLRDSGFATRLESLEKGLDTELTTEFSKDGINLSGGESQKLAIARVFYKNAGLMILDEPSSALDPIAEYQLNHAMLSATTDKTVIFISHRLSTTRIADRIIMLENGRIVEQGSHDDLLRLDGKYAQMWKVQAGAYITV